MQKTPWTEDRLTLLKELLAVGQPKKTIAEQLNTTPAAINAAMARYKLRAPTDPQPGQNALPPEPPTNEPPPATPLKHKTPKTKQPEPEPPAPPTRPLHAYDRLPPHGCRWPLGDPREPDFSFCGELAPIAHPYCETHTAMAWVPGRAPQRKA